MLHAADVILPSNHPDAQYGYVILESTEYAVMSGSNTISVNCTKSTPYFIGLAPSAANGGTNSGSGAMASTGGVAGNTDKVAYQLRSTAGASGTVWGNTATTSTVGNGVAGTGNGSAQSHTVYATVPSANYTADSYADTVTVTVNY